ncbi:SDR family oxidoreductase [Salinirubellus salinus]|uniref:Peroxisomal trans-2-enoyl-CoA reductase n=1 Tax=Salinirubellus salinus TaxID=1364945 RepID=A0A9E7U9D9_9EURY|nr:SDR family oxidoreductase [Salinirubellus salinus]UWM55846.1 SDR family oxidoreductase [Salinirubellus salinus]
MAREGTEHWPATPPATALFADDLLDGEVALITGGGTGIGEEIAVAYAELGADVAIASRNMDHLEPVAERIEATGQSACATTVDVREMDRVEEMVETVTDELGDITVLVNNAGANFVTPTESLSANGWRSVVGTILDGTAYCSMAVGERMIEHGEGGSIISMGATNSVNGAPYHAHSGAGKAGVHNLMQTLGAEWAKFGIRANTIAPGIIETEGIAGAVGGELPEMLLEEIHADRFGQPADCVPLAVFLASPAANYVTGAYYSADGGHLLPNVPF